MSTAEFVETIVTKILDQNLSSEKYYKCGGSVNTLRQCVERDKGIGKKVIEILTYLITHELDNSKKTMALDYIKQHLSTYELSYFNKNPDNIKAALNFIAKKTKTTKIKTLKSDNYKLTNLLEINLIKPNFNRLITFSFNSIREIANYFSTIEGKEYLHKIVISRIKYLTSKINNDKNILAIENLVQKNFSSGIAIAFMDVQIYLHFVYSSNSFNKSLKILENTKAEIKVIVIPDEDISGENIFANYIKQMNYYPFMLLSEILLEKEEQNIINKLWTYIEFILQNKISSNLPTKINLTYKNVFLSEELLNKDLRILDFHSDWQPIVNNLVLETKKFMSAMVFDTELNNGGKH